MSPPVVMLERRAGGVGGAPRPRLGEILVGRQALDRRRLETALARQPDSGRQLGDLLVAQGWASGGAVAGALAEQWGLDFADLESDPPDGGLVQPELAELYLRHRILPWQRIGGVTIHVTDRPERATAVLAALGEAALGEAGNAIAVAPSRQMDETLGRVLGVPLAKRAAERTAAGESVRGLGRARLMAALGVVAAVVLMIYGGTVGLALVLGSLLILNLAHRSAAAGAGGRAGSTAGAGAGAGTGVKSGARGEPGSGRSGGMAAHAGGEPDGAAVSRGRDGGRDHPGAGGAGLSGRTDGREAVAGGG